MSDTGSQPKRLCVHHEIKPQNHKAEICTIDRLNDFCLLQILNRLDISDLFNVTDVNHQFKRVSKLSFAERHATFHFPKHLKLFFPRSSASYVAQMRKVLCKFGNSIKSMKLKDFDPAGIFIGIRVYPIEWDTISKFCAGTLNDLQLDLFFNLKCNDSARPLFSSLKSLTIQCRGFEGGAGRLFSECQELRILRLTEVPYNDSLSELAQQYPKLDELYVEDTGMLTAETTVALLQMNRQIKKLNLSDDNANKTIFAVASKLNVLEELVLRQLRERNSYYDNVTELSGLRSLKVLELHDVAPDFVAAIEAMENIPLDCFKWFNCPSDLKFTKRITKLKTLTRLALTGICFPFDDCLTELGKQLPLLHELELGFKHQEHQLLSIGSLIKFVERSKKLDALLIHTNRSELPINQNSYDQLLEVVERRRLSSKTFKVTIHCRGFTSLQLHGNALHVEEGYFLCNHCDSDSYTSSDDEDGVSIFRRLK